MVAGYIYPLPDKVNNFLSSSSMYTILPLGMNLHFYLIVSAASILSHATKPPFSTQGLSPSILSENFSA